MTGAYEGLHVVQILEAASKSLKNDGAPVIIDFNGNEEPSIEQPSLKLASAT